MLVELLRLTKLHTTRLKAQVITIDFVILSLIIMIMLFAFIHTWNFLGLRWNNISDYNNQYVIALFATDSLVTSAGNPPSWENLAIVNGNTSFGLVNERNIINIQKLNRLANISIQNYSLFKQRLGLTNYEVFINVTDLNRTISYYRIGNPAPQLNQTVSFERFVFFNGSISILKLEVWK